MIREDSRVKGIRIPGPDGSTAAGRTVEVKERSLADDVAICLGKNRARKANKALAGRLQRRTAELRAGRRRGSVRFTHVRAHRGDAGNETVDGLAKWAAIANEQDLTPRLVRQRADMLFKTHHLHPTPSPPSTQPSNLNQSSSSTSSVPSTSTPAPESLASAAGRPHPSLSIRRGVG